MRYARHPLGQFAIIMVLAFLIFEFGIWLIPPLLGMRSAPIPNSVLLQYMATVFVGALIYVSDNEERWQEFKRPLLATLVEPELRKLRLALAVALPLLVGGLVLLAVRPTVAAPPSLRSVHPAPPTSITFQGRTLVLAELNNPLRAGDVDAAYRLGRTIYTQNCMPCHGDDLTGDGYYARSLSPRPLSFTDAGTLPQLSESYVFWRIAKGGVGLPREGAPWHSAMPAWEDVLSEEEIWATIIFLYEQVGATPRAWHEGEH
jgi:mono/diheme cytochrome c family protein